MGLGERKKTMKNTNKVLLLAGVLALSGSAIAGIQGSKHDLSAGGGAAGTVAAGDANGEICVFCHTPHGSDTTASVPLWNKGLTETVFTTYATMGSSSIEGGTEAVGSVSLACLSCHDGVQAMDVMINQPGSGGYDAAGAGLTGETWTGSATGGVLANGRIATLGNDLTNDHPIGIQYAGGGYNTTTPGDGTTELGRDGDFNIPKYTTINTKPVWYIETSGGDNGKDKADLPLYTRTSTASMEEGNAAGTANATTWYAAGVDQPFVECGSCHDPHETTNNTFLRIDNTDSAVCLACHDK
jgi:predicted CXXCH cytochrome family protein